MPTTSSSVEFDVLKEDALANIERLFTFWNLAFTKVSPTEYDFLSPTRADKHFGAVRFNIEKGLGADFASVAFSEQDFSRLGHGFDTSDVKGVSRDNKGSGFDIIGLCQQVHDLTTYKQAARKLRDDLEALNKSEELNLPPLDSYIKRKAKIAEDRARKISFATRLFNVCRPYAGTLGEKYLASRSIVFDTPEANIYFHPSILCSSAKKYFPALIFPIQSEPGGEIKGIHRIYLSEDGSHKANVDEPKMALGDVKGNAIWFGEPGEVLYVAEGPENALTLRVVNKSFVVCTINASNFSNLQIPACVKKIVLCPDPDEPGRRSVVRASTAYKDYKLSVLYPKKKILASGKLADFNDLLMAGGE